MYPGVRVLAAERGCDHEPPAAAPRPLRLHRHQHPRTGRQDRALEGWVTSWHYLALLIFVKYFLALVNIFKTTSALLNIIVN